MSKRIWFSLTIVLLLAFGFATLPPAASAHTITVDGDPSEWTLAAPTNVNTGHIGRNSSVQGEYIWTDHNADVRTDGDDPDSNYELTQFRVTADANNVYFLLRFSYITNTSLPYVAIAVDTDRVSGSGQSYFGDWADTQTSAAAEWERLIVVNLSKTGYYDTSWTWTNAGSSYISNTNNVIEISMPRTALGISWPATLRFTVIVCQHDGSGGIHDIGNSDALDCVTNYGDPGSTPNTWSEVSDGDVDYYFDVYFNASGEPFPPVLISEVYYDTKGTDGDEEWVQIYNTTGSSISLNGWKVGDAETVDETGEGMRRFPDGYSIASDYFVIVAQKNTGFEALGYPCSADFELVDSDDTPDMIAYTAWTGGSAGSVALSNTADEVLLLDPCDTVVDVVAYEGGSYPGVTNHPGVSTGNSIQRHSRYLDTNDCREWNTGDFETVSYDGTPCSISTVVTLSSFTASANFGMPLALGLAVVIPLAAFLLLRRR